MAKEAHHGHEKGRLEKWGERVRNLFLATAAATAVINPTVVLAWSVKAATDLIAYVANPATLPISLGIAAGGELLRRYGKSQGHGHGGGH